MTATLPSYEIFTPEATRDQFALLRRIRAESPVSWISDLDAYLITRHADVTEALKDRRYTAANATQSFTRLSEADQQALAPVRYSIDLWMGNTSEAGHHRFQKLLKRYFTPATVNGLRPRVRELANELLDEVQGGMDVVRDLAYPLPASIIAEMFGMPDGDRERLPVWSHDMAAIFQYSDVSRLLAGQRSVLEMQDYLRGIVADRRKQPGQDLISMFVGAERDGLVNEDEIVANCVLLLFAGHETTANVIANGLNLLMANPDQFALLKAEPERTQSAVEEMLRCDGPVVAVVRDSLEPLAIGGHEFATGTRFYLSLYTANHDPDVFADPLKFDITRTHNRHVAFGLGAYYCLGAALARVEAEECFRVLLDRHPDIRPDPVRPAAWGRIMPLGHQLKTLPVVF